MTESYADPLTVAAIARARVAHERVRGVWEARREQTRGEDSELSESLEEVGALAADALSHLHAGRWDEAQACAEEAQGLAESACGSERWREFALLVEEAAELGYAAANLDSDEGDGEDD